MALINVRLIKNAFTAEQKQQMARDLTEAMVAIEGERTRAARDLGRDILCTRTIRM